ncbi:hypothetical protein Patl1_17120 [Pistacia atlantica]|uniref:Uncharacterized protein n=1 Tax=Pistacia atlantica TaxID=434234 RepID=A0ACC1B7N5_9ROSI|nr:hypothetical protein Patl1_17120 [Pistacia atlantica]
MGLKCVRVWLLLISMLISLQGWRMEGCLEQERSALLQLKHFFNDPNRLQDWVEGHGNSDCCDWESVDCSFETSRVSSLDLGFARNQELGEWYLNVSLLSPFQELKTLYLNGNLIAGCIENEGFERLSHLNNFMDLDLSYNMFNDNRILPVSGLNNLKYLSLSDNMFNNSILSYVSTLSSLKELNLTDIGLKGTVDLQELDSLINLEVLSMGGNEIEKVVISKGETSLRNLTMLYLSNMSISDGRSLLQTLSLFPSLEDVNFYYNNFSGAVNTYELSNFTNVREFLFSDSSLHISFLQSVGAFMSLDTLRMEDCEVSGELTDQELPTFKSLMKLDISNTIFNNNNSLQMLGSMTSLVYLSIVNCTFKNTSLDEGICKMPQLGRLIISGNGLTGTFPWWCVANLTSLYQLDISINSFTGHIPMEIGAYLSVLNSFNISRNAFEGSIPSSFGDMKSLMWLDMSNNLLTGGILEELAGCISLQHLALSNNSLQGQIF